jgi:hypothetical protein
MAHPGWDALERADLGCSGNLIRKNTDENCVTLLYS